MSSKTQSKTPNRSTQKKYHNLSKKKKKKRQKKAQNKKKKTKKKKKKKERQYYCELNKNLPEEQKQKLAEYRKLLYNM